MSRFRVKSWQKYAAVTLGLVMAVSIFLTGCGQNTASPAASPAETQAAQRGYILIGYPTPVTGPLGSFGEGTDWVVQRALAAINKDGGIYIKSLNKKLPVKVQVLDTQSDQTHAAEAATELITKDHVDMMMVLHTPDTCNPVDSICERYGIPSITLDDPIDAFLSGGPYKWSYDAFWTMDTITNLYLNMWAPYKDQTDKAVGILCPNDTDGIGGAKMLAQKLPAAGYKMVDPGRFPDNTNDFTALISQFKKEHVDIIVGWVPPPTFAILWRQMHEQGFVPKIATIGKALLFPSDVDALGGNLPNGLTSELWWSPYSPFKSSLTGETAKQLSDAYVTASGKQWTATIGFDYAGLEIVKDVLTRAQSLDPNKIVAAIPQTDLDTIVGHIKYNAQHYAPTPVAGLQWVKGTGKWPWDPQVVYGGENGVIPTTAKMLFPMPQ